MIQNNKCINCGKKDVELFDDQCEECHDKSVENHALETRDLQFD